MVIITKIEVTGRCMMCYAVLFKIWSVCGSILLKMQTLKPQSLPLVVKPRKLHFTILSGLSLCVLQLEVFI